MEFFYLAIKWFKEHLIVILVLVLLITINDALILSDFYSLKMNKADLNTSLEERVDDDSKLSNSFKIDVKGEVKKPGVYLVNSNMNVNDAIKMAGGVKKGATTDNINLSKSLKEEMVIIVSKKSKVSNNKSSLIKSDAIISNSEVVGNITILNDSINSESSLININTASLDELLTLTGIGKTKAEAIISYRNINPFNSVEDILNVSGIGDALFEKFKDQICV